MAAGAAGGAALLQSAGEAAQRGGMQDSKALFKQAVEVARAESSLQIERDACLGLAEMSWQLGEHSEALAHYDRALLLSQQESNSEAQGMVLLGKGFALMNIGRARDAAEALAACKELSSSNPAQESFVADLLTQAEAAALQQEQQGGLSAPAPKDDHARTEEANGSSQRTGEPEDNIAAGMEPQADKRNAVSVEGAQDTSDSVGRFENAVRSAFVKSVVLKECVVLVMEGSPSAAATPQHHAIAQALQQIRLRLHYIDTTNDADLAQEFVNVWAGQAQGMDNGPGNSTQSSSAATHEVPEGDDRQEAGRWDALPLGGDDLPLLFVGGKLFGGSVRIGHLRRQGAGPLKQAILDALPAHMSAQDRDFLFTAPEVEMREWAPPTPHACGGSGQESEEGGDESKEACKTKHTDRLRRLVSFVAAKTAARPLGTWDSAAARYPRDSEAVIDFLSSFSAPSSSAGPGLLSADAAQVAEEFVTELSTTLGGLALPSDLLQILPRATAADIVNYIETVCPAQGDCNVCPTKVTCKAHEVERGDGSLDIEDAGSAAPGYGGGDRIDIPKAARSVKIRSSGRAAPASTRPSAQA